MSTPLAPLPRPDLPGLLPAVLGGVARGAAALTVWGIRAVTPSRPAQPTPKEVTNAVTTTHVEPAHHGAPAAPVPAAVTPRHGRQGGYLSKKCFEQAAKENMPGTYPVELKRPYSVFTQDLMSSGNVFEDKIGARLAAEADPRAVVVITEAKDADGERTEAGKRAKEQATWEAYTNPQVRLIFNARMGSHFESLVSAYLGREVTDADRVSEPDAIELGPVMANGLRAMRFVDVKWHKVTSGKSKEPKVYFTSTLAEPFFPGTGSIALHGALNSDDWMQLAHYYRHAQSLELVDDDASLWGAVIGKEELLVWARLDAVVFLGDDPATGSRRRQSALELYGRAFAHGLSVVDNALARDVDPTVPALTFPEWKDECKECPWKDVCRQELASHGDGGHITLLPGITPARAKAFYAAGIHDVGSLARLDPAGALAGVADLAAPVYQARVSMAQKVHRAPEVEYVDLPRAAIEIDFDYEADTVAGVYMRGVRATGRRRKPNGDLRQRVETHVFHDYSGTDEGELKVFVQMWAYFQDMILMARSRRHSIRFYHYTRYERTQDLRLAAKYAGEPGVPTVAQVEEFYASDLVIDMYEVLSKQLYWPTRSHSIKELARWVRFCWRDETPGGDMSMVWYKLACTAEDPQVRQENVTRLVQYNEDDTHAQSALRDWVSALGAARKPGEKLPSVLTLRAPLQVRPRVLPAS